MTRDSSAAFEYILKGLCVYNFWFSLGQVFLVRRSAALQRKVLCVRMKEDQSGTPISHFPVRESQYSKSLPVSLKF